jgi:hypothetical protein
MVAGASKHSEVKGRGQRERETFRLPDYNLRPETKGLPAMK